MKKFIVKSFTYLLILMVIANAIAFVGVIALKRGQFYKPSFIVNAFKPEESFNIVVFGSSRSLAAIDTKMITEKLGGLSVNLSMDYTALPTTKLMLEHFYAQNYTAKLIVISLDLPDFDTSKVVLSENDYRFFPFKDEPYIKNYYSNYEEGILKPLSSSAWLPFLGFGFYNMELLGPTLISIVNPEYKYQFDYLGNFQYPDYLGIEEMPDSRYFNTILENPILGEIQELALSHSSTLVIYIAPYLRDKITISDSCPYLVINHSQLLDDSKYFSDYIHVVNSGKKLATTALIEEFERRF